MNNSFEEMMKTCINLYINSEEGQKVSLIAMIDMLNNNNLNRLNILFSKHLLNFENYENLKNIIVEIETLLSLKTHLPSTMQIKTLYDANLQIYNILYRIEYEITTHLTVKNYIDKIYKTVSIINIKPRVLSLEEFLELNVSDIQTEQTFIENSSYVMTERALESKLKKYGYSVAWDNPLSNKERQNLLKALIESDDEISKSYVINYLKHNIQINGQKKNNELAVMKWKDDLDFVYKL